MATQPLVGQYVARAAVDKLFGSGAPVAGTNAVQTLTMGAGVNGGTFTLSLDGRVTAAIAWSATNATLLAAIQAALDALPNGGTNWIVATAGTLTAGIGTILLTFSGGDLQRRLVGLIVVDPTLLTGGTASIANTTPGVDATGRFNPIGTLYDDLTGGKLYVATAANPPTWVSVGSQS